MTAPARPAVRLSVAMTTYQGERYLRAQLDTIAAQTRLPDELVVADDGSSDATPAIVADFAAAAPFPVRALGPSGHLGLRRNVQRALEAAGGDVVVLADQDDLWRREKLSAIEDAFADPRVMLWFSDAELIDEASDPLRSTVWAATRLDGPAAERLRSGHGLERLLHGQTVTGATMAVRRDVLALALPLPERLDDADHPYLHDGWLAVLACVAGAVTADPRTLTSYRQHTAQVTARSMSAVGTDTADVSESGVSESGEPGIRAPRVERSRSERLRVEEERVRLVAERLRDRALPAGADPAVRAELFRRAEFLAARLAAAETRRGWRGLLSQWRRGRYGEFASGGRTLLADLVGESVPMRRRA